MSIRGYLVKDHKINISKETRVITIIEDRNPIINVWRHTNIFDIIRLNGYDCTSQDSVGEIGCDREDWYNAINGREGRNLSEEEKQIVKEINKYFEKNTYITINCY